MASDAWVEWVEAAELLLDALMVEELRSALLSQSPESPYFSALFPTLPGSDEVLEGPKKAPIEGYAEMLLAIGEELPPAPESAEEKLEALTEKMLAIDTGATKPAKAGCGSFEVLLQNSRVSCQQTLGDPGPDVFRLGSVVVVVSKSLSVDRRTIPKDYNHSSTLKFTAGKVDTTTHKLATIRYEGESLLYAAFVLPYVDDPKAAVRAEFLRSVVAGVYRQEKIQRRSRYKVLTARIDRIRRAAALTEAQRVKLFALQQEREAVFYKVLAERLEVRVRGNGLLAPYQLVGYVRCEKDVPVAALAVATSVKQANPNFGKSVVQRGKGRGVYGPLITVGKTRGEYRTHPEILLRVL